MQIALNEKNVIREPHDLKEVMNSWTQQKNYPVIIATLYNSGWVKISMPNFNETDRSWIPLTYTTQSVSNFNATSITDTLWLGCNPKTPTATTFDSNPEVDNWIIVNLQQSAGKLNPSIFWDLTSYLSQETDFIAWYPMIKVFEHMSTILPFSNKRVEKIQFNRCLQAQKFPGSCIKLGI
ncbi:uncharacterized protein LOC112464117 [Temnothorax curvispinosus]|uniref:Uncharacterized protein LOC112464117 n=1 Tax=Temnothorax curvispinosus TaxID=300111 RepID=A0A6J1QXU4_9HYME|nr:uncharacterized protein LOC112464117 [Temnothorax curvispinosus]